MKKIYLVIFLIMCIVSNAQIVNIPDIAFKNFLLTANYSNGYAKNQFGSNIVIDANSDGEIQQSEANNVAKLSDLYYANRANILSIEGIKGFTNLEDLYLFGTSVTTVDVSTMIHLLALRLNYNAQLTSLNITGCTSLTDIYSEHNNITSYSFQSNSLKKLIMNNQNSTQPINSINLALCPNLEFLEINKTNIQSLDFSNMSSLEWLQITNSNLTNNINLTSCTNLNNLGIYNCTSLTNLQLHNLQNLDTVYFSQSPISNLSLNNTTNIESFGLNSTGLTALDLAIFPALRQFSTLNNNFTALNLSMNPLLENITIYDNPLLKNINLKNGGTALNVTSWFHINNNNPSLNYICCDNDDFAAISNYLSTHSLNNIVLNSYCSFTPGGTYYKVIGNTKYDINNNGCDINDVNKPLQKFSITSGSVSGNMIANSTGNYSIPLQAETHTITPISENPAYWTISPTFLTVTFPAQTSPLTQNFCLTANGNHNDLEVVILPITAASPGFDAKYKIVYKNKGTTTQAGTLVFNYNDNLMNFLNSTVAPNSQTTGILNWSFTNLLPFETKEIILTFNLNTPTQTPALNGGDILHYTAQINGTTDETPADNIFTLNQTVVNSFDPNDKTCLEGTAITQTQVGEYVHYLIRFENTGTANAQNIVVKDEIDISKYDLSSLVALNASHSFVTRITGNAVEFIFENIQLPFNNATNDGYVSFKIKTKSNLTLGDSFSNTAKIYFDYNHPIITNTYTTTVQNVLSTSEISNDKTELSIYPNPVKDVLNIQSKNQIVKAEIYDVNGRILVSTSLKGNSIHVSELPKGNYIIKLFSKDKATVHKFIKN
ncbi:T9SS type A sorting domain-containing protein [Chryseobacterium sp. Ch-15]|uniref:T9SS type A sorting domain-containing protein n=1 Tax=Chryseobacterium muglaense TaxID=2893752 RepID=A0A9Q3YUV2_9FLAO|nr:T9SS type A sorting domain-containing protein [Chryseobacterium muglaense]MBD3905234.1 T9SS type A sorting domain-containing protein [Chryseobacterium muglaense]MCC9034060.1 T9SS type A sorting domain-containing protein [Chryseobacterium muglaense]MCM2555053.1 T9SS type A sorting domain-containing protein [Chryseobacterium muglaense]